MAHFLSLNIAGYDVIVNIDQVDYIMGKGAECALHFGPGHSLRVDKSAYEVIGLMQDAKKTPAK